MTGIESLIEKLVEKNVLPDIGKELPEAEELPDNIENGEKKIVESPDVSYIEHTSRSSLMEQFSLRITEKTSANDATKSAALETKAEGLTEEEKTKIKEETGWSDEKLMKCTIDENGVIHYKTDRSDLEGKTTENGVPYKRRTIEINGVVIEGVFPEFESIFDTKLDPDNLKTKAYAKECNEALKEAVNSDPELRNKFTAEQLHDIEEGRTPRGYVWHHNEEPGKMQLVKREDHDRAIGGAAHTGGNSLWGADSVDNSKKGESF